MPDYLQKLKKLKPYKVYDNPIFADDQRREKADVWVSRAKEKGLIVEIGKGKFYRRKLDELGRPKPKRYNNPQDRYALRSGQIAPGKYALLRRLFWSNLEEPIALDNYLCAAIEDGGIEAYPLIQRKFGDRKVIEVYLERLRAHKIRVPEFEAYFEI